VSQKVIHVLKSILNVPYKLILDSNWLLYSLVQDFAEPSQVPNFNLFLDKSQF